MRPLLAVLLLVLSTGCASTGSPGSRRDQTRIERDEIAESNQTNALDLVRTLRPHWLRHRGVHTLRNEPDVVIYIDGIRSGDPSMLAQIPTINIEMIRFYNAQEAQFKFGVGHLNGAIDVTTRRG